tara:strand:+ start:199 stop:564 length:366 start_codon:yes stop_codon:yes gene_type:complete
MLSRGYVKLNFDKQTITIIFFVLFIALLFWNKNTQPRESYINSKDYIINSIKKEIIVDLVQNKKNNPSLFDDATFNAIVININKANKNQLKNIIVNGLMCLASGQGHAVRPGLPGAPKIMI